MPRPLVVLGLAAVSACVLDFDQLVLVDGNRADAGTPGPPLLAVGAACTASSQCVTGLCATTCVRWARSLENVPAGSTVVDPSGRPWWVGWFNTTTDFGSGPRVPDRAANAFASRRLASGQEDSTFTFRSSITTLGHQVFTPDGGLIIAGEAFSPSIGDFPAGAINPNDDLYVSRIDTNTMRPVWMTNFGGFSYERVPRLAVHPSGDVLVTGWSFSTSLTVSTCAPFRCDAGSFALTDGGPVYVVTFVARLDGATGAVRWFNSFYSPSFVASRAIAWSPPDDAVVLGGSFLGSISITGGADGGLSAVPVYGYDAYLIKLDATTGAFTWARLFGHGADDGVHSLAIDPAGNIYSAGLYSSPLVSNPFPAVERMSPFILKVDLRGQPVWGRVLLAQGAVAPLLSGEFSPQPLFTELSVLLAGDGNLVVSGWSTQPLTTDGVQFMRADGGNVNFMFRLGPNNELQTSKILTFSATEGAVAFPAVGPGGNIFLSGTFGGTLTLPLDAGVLVKTSDAGARDFFSASLGPLP
jgi:hypothetical protein